MNKDIGDYNFHPASPSASMLLVPAENTPAAAVPLQSNPFRRLASNTLSTKSGPQNSSKPLPGNRVAQL